MYHRGQGEQEITIADCINTDGTCGTSNPGKKNCNPPENVLCDQDDQFVPFGKKRITSGSKEYFEDDPAFKQKRKEDLQHLSKEDQKWIEGRKKKQDEQDKQYDEFLNQAPQETGTSHAATIEHVSAFGTYFLLHSIVYLNLTRLYGER